MSVILSLSFSKANLAESYGRLLVLNSSGHNNRASNHFTSIVRVHANLFLGSMRTPCFLYFTILKLCLQTEQQKQAAADVLYQYSQFVMVCIGEGVRPSDLRMHLMKVNLFRGVFLFYTSFAAYRA